jgi:hypothetical protein
MTSVFPEAALPEPELPEPELVLELEQAAMPRLRMPASARLFMTACCIA